MPSVVDRNVVMRRISVSCQDGLIASVKFISRLAVECKCDGKQQTANITILTKNLKLSLCLFTLHAMWTQGQWRYGSMYSYPQCQLEACDELHVLAALGLPLGHEPSVSVEQEHIKRPDVNNKEFLCITQYSRTQLYFIQQYTRTTTTCFDPICGPSSGCDWTFGAAIQDVWGVL